MNDTLPAQCDQFRGTRTTLRCWDRTCTACLGASRRLSRLARLGHADYLACFFRRDEAASQSAAGTSIAGCRLARNRGINMACTCPPWLQRERTQWVESHQSLVCFGFFRQLEVHELVVATSKTRAKSFFPLQKAGFERFCLGDAECWIGWKWKWVALSFHILNF